MLLNTNSIAINITCKKIQLLLTYSPSVLHGKFSVTWQVLSLNMSLVFFFFLVGYCEIYECIIYLVSLEVVSGILKDPSEALESIMIGFLTCVYQNKTK